MSDYRDGALFGENAAFVEECHDLYLQDPSLVSEAWRDYFDNLASSVATVAPSGGSLATIKKQRIVDAMITQYRYQGARASEINPLEYDREPPEILNPQAHGFDEADMAQEFLTDIAGMESASLADIMTKMHTVYCGSVAPEFMHINERARRHWLRERFEAPRQSLSKDARLRLLERLSAAEVLENFLHVRYTGQKRFSLEGGDSLIPLLDTILLEAGNSGVLDTVIGMAHRGRLNVLINILGKQPSDLFLEFEGKQNLTGISGDVKYHMGFSSALNIGKHKMRLALAFNPSHLEIVGPVVEGSVRARQDRRGDTKRKQVLPILIHGDAAFAGQGVVMETFNFSQAHGFKTGGTVHVIVNNQIGFTTSSPDDARSTFFCSDVAKMIEAPIIHVNCDDLDGVAFAAQTALEYRQLFGADIVIDLVCFRRHGHNEQDEPLMTQPLMYQKIAKHVGSRAMYAAKLQAEGVIAEGEADAITQNFRERLEKRKSANPDAMPVQKSSFVDWEKHGGSHKDWDWSPSKPLPLKTLKRLGNSLSEFPQDFAPHRQLQRLVALRREMALGKRPLDWGMAENLAYATLLEEGFSVRLSGQDCGRGTFAHRHVVWHHQKRHKRDGGIYVPLRNISKKQGDFLVIDSILSEEAVLGFEYGYATTEPDRLIIWEGQFGDFANGAQVVIDQFISSGEAKWGRYCGLVMLLPHGYEGQGPEHSSARIERYLQMCAEYNMQVCVPSTPAQIFHLLRRQMKRATRMPLIIVSPKSLLRHPQAVSSLQELSTGSFEAVIGEVNPKIVPTKVKRVVFCSGKIYYELLKTRDERKIKDIAIIRLEQLYPFPHKHVEKQTKKYANASHVVWCQEEPGNQGAWHRIQHYFRRRLHDKQALTYALRPSSASPATGRADIHRQQQEDVINAALDKKSVV